MRVPASFVALLAMPLAAEAARPFVTDDARLTTAQSCQLETWVRSYPDSRETWVLPACNPTGNLEFTVGGGVARDPGGASTRDYIVQLKTLFRPLETNGWGWGLGVGRVFHPEVNPGPNLLGNTYAYLPFSASFADNRVVLHGNLGALRDRATRGHRKTWGVGGEFEITPRASAIAESFGDDRAHPYWQVGGRLAVVPGQVQIDATVGQQFSGPRHGRWISIGLRLTPDRLF